MKTHNTSTAPRSNFKGFFGIALFFFTSLALQGQESTSTQSWNSEPIVYLDSTEGNDAYAPHQKVAPLIANEIASRTSPSPAPIPHSKIS